MNLRTLARATLLAALPLGAAGTVRAQVASLPGTDYHGAQALGLALRRMGTTGRILMIGAHPDDENNPMLALLALRDGADIAYMSLTRGEGGQNAIGADFQEALGIIRSEELLAARRVDGAGQFFGREYDYGFSKNADEAFRHWPRDSMLSDVVRIIRLYRPDVVISVWTGTPRDGHGQHQVSGIVAKEAFSAAGDSTRFPELAREGLRPWAPKKLYEGAYFTLDSATIRFPLGEMDPLLGMSYAQVAAIARARHRSQDQGAALPFGPRTGGLRLVVDRTGAAPAAPHPESSLFAGIDTTLSQRAAAALGAGAPATKLFAQYDSAVLAARAAFDPLRPDAVEPLLARANRLLAAAYSAAAGMPAGKDVAWYTDETADARAALAAATGVVLDAVASKEQVVPGDTLDVYVKLWNGGKRPVVVDALTVTTPAWTAPAASTAGGGSDGAPAGAGSPVTVAPESVDSVRVRVVVPADAAPTQPYYLRLPRHADLYTWAPGDPAAGLPFQPPPIVAAATVTADSAVLRLSLPVTFRAVNPREGEVRRPVRIVPAASVETDRAVAVLPVRAGATLPLVVRVSAPDGRGISGTLRPTLPAGWRASPADTTLTLGPDEMRTVRFTLAPPAGVRAGAYDVSVAFRDAGGREYARGYRLIDYPHIRPHPLWRDARTTVQAVDVFVPKALRVAYIMGAGDEVPAALEQLGVRVQALPASAVAGADLSRFDDIVVGVRAYEVEPDLVRANRRLLDWVRAGGTLIVQYQQAGWAQANLPPYPLAFNGRMGDRVTDETAPVRVVEPASPALTTPNRIGEADWQGWVQERGLWFPRTWDSHYQAPLEMNDPGEQPLRGALLIAPYGKGMYVYTGLAFFRQLPAGVPGAYRLFANLLALGHGR